MVIRYNKVFVACNINKSLKKKRYNKKKEKVNVSSRITTKQITPENRLFLQSLGYQLNL